jgi:Mrp family chromosome partitioning ATPase
LTQICGGQLCTAAQVLKNDRGLSNLLTSNSEPEGSIVEDANLKNLFILPAGPAPPNPAELLAAGVFGNLVDNLSAQFDMVLIDSPPCDAGKRCGHHVCEGRPSHRCNTVGLNHALGAAPRLRKLPEK